MFEDGALSPNYYNLCFDKQEIKKIYEYIIKVFPENKKEEIVLNNYGIHGELQKQYYYITVKYDEYNNGKPYCYISEDATIKKEIR